MKTWEDRKREAKNLIALWHQNRTAVGVVTLKRGTRLSCTSIEVVVGEYTVVFNIRGNRTVYEGEFKVA